MTEHKDHTPPEQQPIESSVHPETHSSLEEAQKLQTTLTDIFLGQREQQEKEEKQYFSTVVFGHSFKDFDLDQLFTYYFALKLGLIPPNAEIIFTTNVHDTGENGKSYFDDPSYLVIEGFGHTPEEKSEKGFVSINTKRSKGNFANGPKDEPAAAELMRQFGSTHKADLEQKKELKDFTNWITATEDRKKRDLFGKMDLIKQKQLDPIKHIFYGLKAKYSEDTPENKAQLVIESITALEDIMSGATTAEITEKYAEIMALAPDAVADELTEHNQALQERLTNPETFKQVTTLSGTTITFFDIRGIPISKGAVGLANTKHKHDILLFVSDHYSAKNTNEVVGTEYKIYLQNSESESGDTADQADQSNLLALLADRLQQAEAQFGSGYEYSEVSSFGSHDTIVASPQSAGSSIESKSMWRALQNFFDYPRYSVADFKQKTAELAQKLGTEQYTILPVAPSETSYQFGSRQMVFTLPSNEGQITTTLTEEDLPFYEPLFTDDPQQNVQLLLERTSISEPAAVITAKQEQLETWTDTYLASQDAERLLELLGKVNENSITSLATEKKIAILHTISQNAAAIGAIWDKDNLTYAVIDARLPEEILPFTDAYKLNRYKLKSLAHSIDTTLVNNTIAEAVASRQQTQQDQLATSLLAILQNKTYKQTHTKEVYDTLLQNLLFFAAEVVQSNRSLAERILSELEHNYGSDMHSHWQQIDPSYRDLLKTNFPDSTLATLIPEDQVQTIPGLAGSKVREFDQTASLERMISSNDKTITVLVEVTRPIAARVMRSDFKTTFGEMKKLETLDAHYSTGAFNLERKEHLKLVSALIPTLRTAMEEILLDDTEAKLRIIQGGFINVLTAQLQSQVTRILFEIYEKRHPDAQASEIREKVEHCMKEQIVWSSKNRQTDSYEDSPFMEELL